MSIELSAELAKIAREELGEDPSRIPSDLQAIKDWLDKQGHIKARTDDKWLKAFLRGGKYSLEKTKEKMDMYYTMKTMIPEISKFVDPMDSKIQVLLSLGVSVVLPKLGAPDDPRIIIVRPGFYDTGKFDILDCMGLTSMLTDMLLLEDDNTSIVGNRYIVDLKNVTLGHMAQMSPGNVKKIIMYFQGSLPIRDKGAHMVNIPPGSETVFSLMKRFMSEKNKNRLFFHNEDTEELHKYFPKEIMPEEYGGSGGSIQAMIDHWRNKLEDHREWFLEHAQYRSDESRRPGKPKTTENLFGIEGSFRKLDVD